MDVKLIYPHVKRRKAKAVTLRASVASALLLGALVCGIVNLCAGGAAWSLLVMGAEVLFWFVFVDRPLVGVSFMGLFTRNMALLCGYLLLIEVVDGGGWAVFTVMVLAYSALIVQGLLFFFWFKRQKHNLLPLFSTVAVGLAVITAAVMGFIELNWPAVVLGGLSLAVLLLSFIVYPEQVTAEFQKKFHIK